MAATVCPECGGTTPEGFDPAYSHTEDCSQHVDNLDDHTFAPGMSDDSDPDQKCTICGLTEPEHTPCAACNAEPGEDCRPGCIGKAAHDEGDA